MFERFTDRARRVLVLAQEEARLLDHNFIGTEHLLLGLISEHEGVAARALRSSGVTLDRARQAVADTIGPTGRRSRYETPPFTPRAKKVLDLSNREAKRLGHPFIGTEHLLLGVIREGDGVAVQVLVGLGADLRRLRDQVITLLSGFQPDDEPDPPLPPDQPPTGTGSEPADSRLGRLWRKATATWPRSELTPLPPGFLISGEVNLDVAGGQLTGTVAGLHTVLTIDRDDDQRLEGSFAGAVIAASCRVGDPAQWPDDRPAQLRATYSEAAAILRAWVHIDAYVFRRALIEGTFQSQPVTGSVTGDETGEFEANGLFVDHAFSLRGIVTPGSEAVLQGSISGRPVDLLARAEPDPDRDATVAGHYDGPGPFLLLLLGALLYFL